MFFVQCHVPLGPLLAVTDCMRVDVIVDPRLHTHLGIIRFCPSKQKRDDTSTIVVEGIEIQARTPCRSQILVRKHWVIVYGYLSISASPGIYVSFT